MNTHTCSIVRAITFERDKKFHHRNLDFVPVSERPRFTHFRLLGSVQYVSICGCDIEGGTSSSPTKILRSSVPI